MPTRKEHRYAKRGGVPVPPVHERMKIAKRLDEAFKQGTAEDFSYEMPIDKTGGTGTVTLVRLERGRSKLWHSRSLARSVEVAGE